MNQTEDYLQDLIEQLEYGDDIDNVVADLPANEVAVIHLIDALRHVPDPPEDKAIVDAQEAQLLAAVAQQYGKTEDVVPVAALSYIDVLRQHVQNIWLTINSNRELAFGLTILAVIIAATWMFSSRPAADQMITAQLDNTSVSDASESDIVISENSNGESVSSETGAAADSSEANEESVAAVPNNNPNSVFIPILSVGIEVNAQTAVIQDITGLVQIQVNGTWQTINQNSALKAGQHIRTGDLSQATLVFYDGSRAHLDANTEMSIDQLDAKRPEEGFRTVVMTQWLGDSEHEVDHRGDNGSLYEVKTPEGSGIARGTKFKVIVTPEKLARYIVTEGKVDVSGLNRTVSVTAGQLTTLLVGSPPETPHFSITGQGQVGSTGSEWMIAGQTFATDAHTIIIGNPQVGDLVFVEGHLLEDGGRVADRIILLRRAVANQFNLTGEVSEMGTAWVVAGQTIVTNAETTISEGILVGDRVRVDGVILENGTLQAKSILRLETAPGLPFQFSGIVQVMNDGSWIISGQSVVVADETAVSPTITVGDTVAVSGWILEDNSWLATNINLLEEELPTFDFTGQIYSIDPWIVAGISFNTDEWTAIDPSLVVGDEVRVQGTVLSDGTWVATSVTLIEDALPNIVTFTGIVMSIDPWIVNGLPLNVTDDTVILGDIVPGITVIVSAQLMPDGTWIVYSIRPLVPHFGLGCVVFSSPIIMVNNDVIKVKHWHLDIKKDGRIKIHGNIKKDAIVTLPICISWNDTIIIGDIVVIYQPTVIIINPGNTVPPGCRVTSKGSIKCSEHGSSKKSS